MKVSSKSYTYDFVSTIPTGRKFDMYQTHGHNVCEFLENVVRQSVPRRKQDGVIQGELSPCSFIRYETGVKSNPQLQI